MTASAPSSAAARSAVAVMSMTRPASHRSHLGFRQTRQVSALKTDLAVCHAALQV